MKYILIIFFVFLFSFNVISCSSQDSGSSSTSIASDGTTTASDGTTTDSDGTTTDSCFSTSISSRQLARSSNDYAYGVATDSSGNVYVAGGTNGGLDGNTNAGNTDLFVVKYNSSGTKQWTRQLGSSSRDSANGVATDSSGNVYVTGMTNGGLDGCKNAGIEDLFVVKYNSSGTKQWTNQLGSSSRDSANDVATDSSGNIYVTGTTYWELDGNTSAGKADLFVVKYNSSGTKQWTKQNGTDRYDEARGVATDSSGNVYVVGYTYGGLDGNTNTGGSDLFVVKYNSSGTKQ